MRFYRVIIMLLLTIFLADTVSASASLHLPAFQAGTQADVHQHHAMPGDMQHDAQAAQQADSCKNCHDCLSCFSVLPLAFKVVSPYLPHHQLASASIVIYYPPALAQLQRPPIPLSV
ncbi:hypothetical protein LG198_13530 [Methylobacillus arboreus]|uniref:hypothetical protein n=1 Tax=Methylobacillus arboreus TaxID=755170 RepID=UPI001E374A5E|nr:hypothetical protein [Methylobacillus arboreus]MCB5191755.1 hypothetical protein [Methylobacillus arboreus]